MDAALTADEEKELDIVEEAGSCPAHFIPCQGTGTHNDGRAVQFWQQKDCDACAKLVAERLVEEKRLLRERLREFEDAIRDHLKAEGLIEQFKSYRQLRQLLAKPAVPR